MKIENQQELEKLIKLLRKTGVESLKFGELELRLRAEEPLSKYKQRTPQETQSDPGLDQKALEEQLLFWSSTPPGMQEA